MTNADGTPIDAAKRVKIYSALAGGNPVHMLHPAADTWTLVKNGVESFEFEMKLNEFNRAGVCPQFAPDKIVRAVEYDPTLSYFKSASDYQVWFDGGYLATPSGKASAQALAALAQGG